MKLIQITSICWLSARGRPWRRCTIQTQLMVSSSLWSKTVTIHENLGFNPLFPQFSSYHSWPSYNFFEVKRVFKSRIQVQTLISSSLPSYLPFFYSLWFWFLFHFVCFFDPTAALCKHILLHQVCWSHELGTLTELPKGSWFYRDSFNYNDRGEQYRFTPFSWVAINLISSASSL